MTRITDEAVRDAEKAWRRAYHAKPFTGDDHSWMRAALEAALPHLTDDGVALPVRRDGEGALAAASSSPPEHLVGLYDDTRTLTVHGSINHEVSVQLGNEEVFFTWAGDFLATAQRAAYEAGEGATPAIDREALEQAIERGAVNADLAKYFKPGDTDQFVNAILALIEGAS